MLAHPDGSVQDRLVIEIPARNLTLADTQKILRSAGLLCTDQHLRNENRRGVLPGGFFGARLVLDPYGLAAWLRSAGIAAEVSA